MGTENLYIKCENEDCGRMALYKMFDLRSDGSRGKQTTYQYGNDEEWSANGSGNSKWRCPYCGTAAGLTIERSY